MRYLWLTLNSLLTLGVLTAAGSNYGYHGYPVYHYPVYQYPQVQVYNNTVYQPYAVPLYSVGYVQPTAVISGAVAYQQTITATTTATAGAQSTVQTVQGAAVGLAQQQQAQAVQANGAQQVKEDAHIAYLRTHCADCHSGQGARKGFAIFDANRSFTLDPKEFGKVFFRLTTNKADPQTKRPLRMPPDTKLPQDVSDAILEGLLTQPEPQKKDVPIDPKKDEGF